MKNCQQDRNQHEEEIPIIRPGQRPTDSAENGPEPEVTEREVSTGPEAIDLDADQDLPAAEPPVDLEARIAELQDANLRARADFENYRKRVARQQQELANHVKADFARALLPVLDNLERAISTAEEHQADEAWVSGLRMVQTQFLDALKQNGIEPIESLGQLCDPNIHEVVATMPNELVPAGYITAEVSRGYTLGDTVVRAAQVVTSSGSPEDSE